MAINLREDGKYIVTCRDETGADRYAVRNTPADAEGYFILTAGAKSCSVVPSLSFAGLCQWYKLHRSAEGVATAKQTVRRLELHAVPLLGDVKIGKVNAGHLNRMRASMIKAGLASRTANAVFSTIRSMYYLAHCEGRIASNPVSPEMGRPHGQLLARRHNLTYRRAPVVTPDETKFQLLRSVAPAHFRVAFDLMDDWVRYSELTALPTDCTDLVDRTVLIKQSTVRGGAIVPYPKSEWRVLALSPKTVTALRRHFFEMAYGPTKVSPGREGLLFPILLHPNHPMELAHLHDIKGDFTPEAIFNRTVVAAIGRGMTAFEISRRYGRTSTTINKRYHVAFRRRNARALIEPMNANLAGLLA
jgi:hypothetical protein